MATASATFVALDFETANESLDSICQIGVASFADGRLVGSWETLVDPEDGFAKKNIEIHGITPDAVKGAPKFPVVFERLCELLLGGQAIAHHCIFERVALARAVVKHQLEDPVPVRKWLDTASVVRLTWPERAYNLAAVAEFLRIEFRHHDALEDARVAGEILLRASLETGLDIASWLLETGATPPVQLTGAWKNWRQHFARDGDPDGPLFGETIVFTGTLSISRSEAAILAAKAGCTVGDSVTKKTTLLVVGDQDIRTLAAGHKKSGKHEKAETLIAKGQAIRILAEADFRHLIHLDCDHTRLSSSGNKNDYATDSLNN